MNRKLQSLALGLLVLALPASMMATSSIKNNWLDAYPNACQTLKDAANDCSLCHFNGTQRNDYAQDLGRNDPATIEDIDSDGDTRTNGQEISDCTLPGDASSVMAADSPTWGGVKSMYR